MDWSWEGVTEYEAELQSVKWLLRMQVGNAVTDGRQIVIGMGSSQVLDAAFFAFGNASRGPDGGHCIFPPPRTLPLKFKTF